MPKSEPSLKYCLISSGWKYSSDTQSVRECFFEKIDNVMEHRQICHRHHRFGQSLGKRAQTCSESSRHYDSLHDRSNPIWTKTGYSISLSTWLMTSKKSVKGRQSTDFSRHKAVEIVAGKNHVGNAEGTAIGKAITYKYRQLSIMT